MPCSFVFNFRSTGWGPALHEAEHWVVVRVGGVLYDCNTSLLGDRAVSGSLVLCVEMQIHRMETFGNYTLFIMHAWMCPWVSSFLYPFIHSFFCSFVHSPLGRLCGLLERVLTQKPKFKPDSVAVSFPLWTPFPQLQDGLRMIVLPHSWLLSGTSVEMGTVGEGTNILCMHPFYSI